MGESEPTNGSLSSSLLKQGGAALALIVVVAVAFWAIGSAGDGEDLVVADAPSDEDDAADDTSDMPVEPDPGGEDTSDPVDDTPDPADDPADEPEPGDDGEQPAGDGDPAADGDADADQTEDDESAGSDDEEPDADDPDPDTEEDTDSDDGAAIPPGDITIQVLDGYQDDGGAAADALAAELAAAGYPIVAQNPALRYEVTTVLWTTGNEAAARQVAAAIGAGDVRANPGSLSESVAVHVVVGSDRG